MHKTYSTHVSCNYLTVIYCISSWHEWLRAGGLYGDFTHDTVLASLIQMCVLVQHANQGIHYSTKVLLLVLMKLIWCAFDPLLLYTLLATHNGQLLLCLRNATPYA